MKMIQVELPERVTVELEALIQDGWFENENEIIRVALLEFIQRNRLALSEQFQREDIAWVLRQRRVGSSINAAQ